MKKIICLILISACFAILFAACDLTKPVDTTENEKSTDLTDEIDTTLTKESNKVINTMKLSDIIDKVYSESSLPADDYKYYVTNEINKDSCEYFFGKDFNYIEAVSSEPEIGYGYSFCLVRVDESKTNDIAKLIEENAKLDKWVCVSAEYKTVAVNGNVIMLCMTKEETCTALKTAFLNIK
ncbi:hypothetical protein SDC9_128579 [bioreactor metagenome]|uniref:DUF4358 domain-containing protein n=1 Tax=bioreactor metagenome TaxID=1076179 RepID=A0A645CWL9_9ZZZZ|nr:hypothetical protein [Oscillospiraceae bacterium]